MNDNETKVMTFTSVAIGSVPVGLGSVLSISPFNLLNGVSSNDTAVSPNAGRLYFAGMMFDRFRFRSISCTIRPRIMPNTTATNYTLYVAWDRYGTPKTSESEPQSNGYSIQSDPSAKQITWSAGGSGSALRTYIYATNKDRYQYFPINHANQLSYWSVDKSEFAGISAPFFPVLMLAIDAITAPSTNPSVSILTRATVEFQGGYSSTTLNYSMARASGASALSAKTLSSLRPDSVYELRRYISPESKAAEEDVDTLTDRIQKFQLDNPE